MAKRVGMLTELDEAMSKDMSAPNWKRTVKRLRRLMAELREYDVQTIEPPNFDTPPGKRYAQGGIQP